MFRPYSRQFVQSKLFEIFFPGLLFSFLLIFSLDFAVLLLRCIDKFSHLAPHYLAGFILFIWYPILFVYLLLTVRYYIKLDLKA